MNLRRSEKGFTIVELMIATAVLATMLLILTIMLLSIGKLYYRGLNQARVQDSVRNVTDDISAELQLASNGVQVGGPVMISNGGTQVQIAAYCIGTTRYTYNIGTQIGTGTDTTTPPTPQIQHVLWKDTNTSGGCAPLNLAAANPSGGVPTSSDGAEMAPPNSRLTNFSITGTPAGSTNSPFVISIEIAYGNADLLTAVSGPAGSVNCRGGTGDQYCATSSLVTTVVKRL
jgi:prepilin-type N-terminal cleavage/methylation domain-containing protein